VFPVYRTPSTNPANPQFSFLADSQDNFAWAGVRQPRLRGHAASSASTARCATTTTSARTPRSPRPRSCPTYPGFPAGATGQVREVSFDDWQPKLTLTWMPNADVTVYAGYSRGFRSGGLQPDRRRRGGGGQRHRRRQRHLPGRDRRHARGRLQDPPVRRQC
jgi:iron complex outermembrane receptor protein